MTVSRSQPTTETLVDRLRFPMWVHSNMPFHGPQLDQEENLAAMVEAAARIAELEAELAITRRCNTRVDCLCRGEVMDHAAAVGDQK